MPHLDHLHLLYNDMLRKNEFACVFDINHNGRPFRCVFIADDMSLSIYREYVDWMHTVIMSK